MNRKDIENRLRQISRPEPSPGLRDRVLSSAVVGEQPITWSDRIWFSRAWRVAAVGAVLVIVVLDQVSGAPRRPDLPVSAHVIAEAQVIEETGRQLGLPPDVAASLGRRVLWQASRFQTSPESASSLLQSLEFGDTGGRR